MKCIILGASDISDYKRVSKFVKQDDFIICADGGIKHLNPLGITPDVIIGDFDSWEGKIPYENKIVHPKEKDDTDLGLCIDYACEKGFESCIALGCLGGRIDHTFAGISLIKYAYDKSLKLTLCDENHKIFLLNGEMEVKKDGYKYLSVFPYGEKAEGIFYEGLKYPLFDATLTYDVPLGISNEIVGEKAKIRCEKGNLIIIQSERE